MKQGIFINAQKANCSIYESGLMIYNIISKSTEYELLYKELDRDSALIGDLSSLGDLDAYFFVVNWHHWALPISDKLLKRLPGKKIVPILEVGDKDCFVLTSRSIADAFMVIDPTKYRSGKVYPFPRPLEVVSNLRPILDNNKFVIGSFGLLTGGKRFEQIILEANRIKDCIVRINLPPVTYMGDTGIQQRLVDYADYLRSLADSSIDVRITHNYMNKEELIRWCSEHTINSFPYYRNMAGLSAVTDQAISAKRALAVTSCNTFRHLHKYISYYPNQSYIELSESTLPGVSKMNADWHPDNFNLKFYELLADLQVL